MDTIWTGAARFNKTESPLLQPLMAKLTSEGQHPEALFITCADSRIVPSTITSSGPGDLFTMRNIGNLVPAYDGCLGKATSPSDLEPSMGAALAYALDVLRIPHIIVCGHSECGAMKAVASKNMSQLDLHLQVWLTHAVESVCKLESGEAPDLTLPQHDQLAQINAVQQVVNLRQYPVVARALNEGRVQLHAWYFDMERPEVQVYDEALGKFVRLEERVTPVKATAPNVTAPAPGGHTARHAESAPKRGGLRRETERSALRLSSLRKGEER